MDKTAAYERFAEVLGKQQPYQHGAVTSFIAEDDPIPNLIDARYVLGSHCECAADIEKFLMTHPLNSAQSDCMYVSLN